MVREQQASPVRRWLRRRAWPRLGAVVNDVPVPLLVVDEALTVLECSSAAAALLGWSRYAVVGRPVGEVLQGADPPHPEAVRTRQVLPHAGGAPLVVTWAWSTAGGRVTGVAVLDPNDHAQRSDRLQRAAETDPLTGLWNRGKLQQELVERVRPDAPPLAVLFIDLDRFKVVNDSLGHAAGDELLVEVAARLRQSVRPEDLVARFGGDEFVVVCPQVGSVGTATSVAKRILAALAEPVQLGATAVIPRGSVGIALSAGDTDADEIVRNADIALYRAKERGRGRHVIFDPQLQAEARERLDLEVGLRRAVEHDDLHVHYQPVVEMETGRVLGLEALARWTDLDLGPVGPDRFIPVAEETGLIHRLGQFVLADACGLLARLQHASADAPYVAVNVSGSQFALPGFVDIVTEALAAAGARADGLVVELTEQVLLNDGERQIGTLRRLRALGVRVALDDFGTGHSSLTYLRRFPVDVVKIDRSFVRALADDGDRAIVTAVVSLADALGCAVVAEGVEDPGDAETLVRLGCRQAQGWLFGRPTTPDDAFDRVVQGTAVVPA